MMLVIGVAALVVVAVMALAAAAAACADDDAPALLAAPHSGWNGSLPPCSAGNSQANLLAVLCDRHSWGSDW